MKKANILIFVVFFAILGIFSGSDGIANTITDEKVLTQSGVDSWVPNPLVGSHKWKKFFSDAKHSPSGEAESIWYYDSKGAIKATSEKLDFKGEGLKLEGATLVWVKVAGLKTKETRFLFYALWPENRIVLFFGIFERGDGTKHFEDINIMGDIKRMDPGLEREVLENLLNAIYKPWWKVW
jgi:hypothetical protein